MRIALGKRILILSVSLLGLGCGLTWPTGVRAQQPYVVPSDQEVVLLRADRARVKGDSAAPIRISFPNSTHPRAWPAVEAAFCAGAAGRFWAMHDILFERVDQWKTAVDPVGLFELWAAEIGIDMESYGHCLRNDVTAPLQVADYDSALRSGITSTPFFVVGDSVAIRGAVSLERFRSAVDSVLTARGLETP